MVFTETWLDPGLRHCSRGGLHSPPGPDNKLGEEQGRRCLLHGEQCVVLRCGEYFFGLFSGPGAARDQKPTLLHPEGVYIGRYNSGAHSARCRRQTLDELHVVINRTETSRPEAAGMVADDFNNAKMRKVPQRYHHNISCPRRAANTLDHVHTPYRNAHKWCYEDHHHLPLNGANNIQRRKQNHGLTGAGEMCGRCEQPGCCSPKSRSGRRFVRFRVWCEHSDHCCRSELFLVKCLKICC